MSDRPIQVGDLVQVVRASECGCTSTVGLIFRITEPPSWWISRCNTCGDRRMNTLLYESGISASNGSTYGFEGYRLKRIPPLEELEGQRTQEDMKEPA